MKEIEEIEEIDRKLRSYNAFKPKEIHRAVRELNCMSFWKGSEYRSFLLYYSIVVLKKYITEDEYNNFLRLYCATRICYTDVYQPFIEIAQKWFENYIEGCVSLYGEHTISSNVHNAAHVVNDVKEFGCLQLINTYPFENMLQFLKLRLKQKNVPLEQVTRRLIEASQIEENNRKDKQFSSTNFPQLKYSYYVNRKQVFKEVVIDYTFLLSTRKRSDSWFLTYSGNIVLMNYVTINDCKEITLYGTVLKSKFNYVTFPISSRFLDIYESDGKTNSDIEKFELKSIKAKLICLPNHQTSVFIPILHTLK